MGKKLFKTLTLSREIRLHFAQLFVSLSLFCFPALFLVLHLTIVQLSLIPIDHTSKHIWNVQRMAILVCSFAVVFRFINMQVWLAQSLMSVQFFLLYEWIINSSLLLILFNRSLLFWFVTFCMFFFSIVYIHWFFVCVFLFEFFFYHLNFYSICFIHWNKRTESL